MSVKLEHVQPAAKARTNISTYINTQYLGLVKYHVFSANRYSRFRFIGSHLFEGILAQLSGVWLLRYCTVKTAFYDPCGQRPPAFYDQNSMQG